MKTNEMKKNILEDGMDERFLDIYVDATKLEIGRASCRERV